MSRSSFWRGAWYGKYITMLKASAAGHQHPDSPDAQNNTVPLPYLGAAKSKTRNGKKNTSGKEGVAEQGSAFGNTGRDGVKFSSLPSIGIPVVLCTIGGTQATDNSALCGLKDKIDQNNKSGHECGVSK
ncbi:UNVERIFIED_CONTAM: hypothetical protein FKN15_039227 [Acipenser sinensis]